MDQCYVLRTEGFFLIRIGDPWLEELLGNNRRHERRHPVDRSFPIKPALRSIASGNTNERPGCRNFR